APLCSLVCGRPRYPGPASPGGPGGGGTVGWRIQGQFLDAGGFGVPAATAAIRHGSSFLFEESGRGGQALAGSRCSASRGWAAVALWLDLKPRSRRELLTTNTLENAIAMPASMGLSRPIAATRINATL